MLDVNALEVMTINSYIDIVNIWWVITSNGITMFGNSCAKLANSYLISLDSVFNADLPVDSYNHFDSLLKT